MGGLQIALGPDPAALLEQANTPTSTIAGYLVSLSRRPNRIASSSDSTLQNLAIPGKLPVCKGRSQARKSASMALAQGRLLKHSSSGH